MSLLGFDAVGRLALGQISGIHIILTADTTTYVLSGNAATFQIAELASVGAYIVIGNDAPFLLDRNAWLPLSIDAEIWTQRADPAGVWTPRTLPTSTWILN